MREMVEMKIEYSMIDKIKLSPQGELFYISRTEIYNSKREIIYKKSYIMDCIFFENLI